MAEIGMIIIGSVFVNNIVLTKYLGLCPFFGVSKSTNAAFGMGMAVTFVVTIASVTTWTIYNYVLMPGPSNLIGFIFPGVAKEGMVSILKIVSYILVIATLTSIGAPGLRERLEILDLPKPFRGLPIALISASLMSLAFMGFVGM
jgi:Na+-translocating ferredoxin:NAD+ oxidoreductase subunit A